MIIIVVGMHRSGTSATAGLLHNNNIVMGEEKHFNPKPKANQNPKGFFENRRFRDINDAILKENGYRVKSFDPNIPKIKSVSKKLMNNMVDLIDEYNGKYKYWGFKDPRTCLTLHQWLGALRHSKKSFNLLGQTKIVSVKRDAPSVVKSMMKRRNGAKEQLTKLCEIYYNKYLQSIYMFEKENIEINFVDLCNNTQNTCNFKRGQNIYNNGCEETLHAQF